MLNIYENKIIIKHKMTSNKYDINDEKEFDDIDEAIEYLEELRDMEYY